jgi:hypothetical protein
MSLIDDLIGKISGCFSGRKEERSIANKYSVQNYGYQMRKHETDDDFSDDFIEEEEVNNQCLYDLKKNFQMFIEVGITLYMIKYISNGVTLVNLRYDIDNHNLIVTFDESEKEKNIIINDIIETIYGNKTSSFFFVFKKLEIIPWRCFSLVDKYYQTYDFIAETDDDCFILLSVIEVVMKYSSEKIEQLFGTKNKDKDLCKRMIARLYWKRLFIKLNGKYDEYGF